MRPLVLVVEDEPALVTLLRYNLEREGFAVNEAHDREEALLQLRESKPDAVLLDWMLPRISGLEICRQIRRAPAWRDLPVIMLTARGEEGDRVRGLVSGADDYVVKPFSLPELMARVRAILRRSAASWSSPASLQLGGLHLDLKHQQLRVGGQPRDLTPTEFALLKTLMGNPGHAFTRSELIEKALGYTYEGLDRTLDSHIKNLRKKVDADPGRPACLETVFGVGYRLRQGEA